MKLEQFEISNQEYDLLNKQFGDLAYYIAHTLIKRNSKNNYTDDIDDIVQEIRMAMVMAGQYYKRQVYIEKSLSLAREHVKDPAVKLVLDELDDLWEKRKHHGAGRQKFGECQERILDSIVKTHVPVSERPVKSAILRIDSKFKTYAKSILWNRSKNLGKKISKERSIRNTMVSLSEFDFQGKSKKYINNFISGNIK